MAKFRKKPVVVEAEQFTAGLPGQPGGIVERVVNFGVPKADGDLVASAFDNKHWVQTLEGPLIVSNGDWIICGVKGEFYPCKPDIFAATNELVEEPQSVDAVWQR